MDAHSFGWLLGFPDKLFNKVVEFIIQLCPWPSNKTLRRVSISKNFSHFFFYLFWFRFCFLLAKSACACSHVWEAEKWLKWLRIAMVARYNPQNSQCWCNWSRLSKISTDSQLIWFKSSSQPFVIYFSATRPRWCRASQLPSSTCVYVCRYVCISGNGIACILIKNIRKTLFIWQMSLSLHGAPLTQSEEPLSSAESRGVCRRIRETPNAFEWQIELSHINNVER